MSPAPPSAHAWDGGARGWDVNYGVVLAGVLALVIVVQAQDDYEESGHDGQKPGLFAQKLRSSPGKQDGLYWDVAPGKPASPAGPLLADASAEGYAEATVQGSHTPYHGYYYRMLTAQGPDAQGGEQSYLKDGKLSGGFAVLAYPANYGATGIMTFIVNQDGVVWQAEEVWQDGKWVRYYGFIGRYVVAKVPAAEVEVVAAR